MQHDQRTLRASLAAAAFGAGLMFAPAGASAHFILMEPANALVQNRLGDPQKLAPCGGTTADAGTPTNTVTPVRGGDKLHIKVQETVFHPGHYRVALAQSRDKLPADPETITHDTPKGPYSLSTKVEAKPVAPILADGLFHHIARLAPGLFWETDVKIPNVNCENCTLQVVQWMGEHGHNPDGDFSYHHCSILNITANPKLPIDKRWLR